MRSLLAVGLAVAAGVAAAAPVPKGLAPPTNARLHARDGMVLEYERRDAAGGVHTAERFEFRKTSDGPDRYWVAVGLGVVRKVQTQATGSRTTTVLKVYDHRK